MNVYYARGELDAARKKLNRIQWRLDEGPAWLQGWYRARYRRCRMDWEVKRRVWESEVAEQKEHANKQNTMKGSNE